MNETDRPPTTEYQVEGDFAEIAKALAPVQAKIENPKKEQKANAGAGGRGGGKGFAFSYADLAGVLEAARPHLNEAGLVLLQPPITNGSRAGAATIILGSGWRIEARVTFPTGGKAGPQDYGSSISYARRYGLLGLLGLATEDDDGERGQSRVDRNAKADAARERAAKAPAVNPDRVLAEFGKYDVSEPMLVAELGGTPIAKINGEQRKHLLSILARMKEGEGWQDVMSDAAAAAADGDPFDPDDPLAHIPDDEGAGDLFPDGKEDPA